MITDYAIVCDVSLKMFCQGVNEFIDHGYEPFGELIINHGSFYQVMVMREEKTSL